MRQTLALILVLLLGVLGGCGPTPSAKSSGQKLRVVTTIGMLADAAKNVGGDRVEVIALMGPGTDPHLYKATAGDVKRIDQADLVIALGLDLEGRMSEILEQLNVQGKVVLLAGEAIPKEMLMVSPTSHGRPDPHVWFDLKAWQYVTNQIAQSLLELDQQHAAEYLKGAEEYAKKIEETNDWAKKEISQIPESQRVLITAHDAFHYFGRRYGLQVKGIQGTSTVTEAGAADIQTLANLIAEKGIKAIFVESSVPPNTINALQKAVASRGKTVAIGGELFSDAMGNPETEEGTYIGMVRHNVSTIVQALK